MSKNLRLLYLDVLGRKSSIFDVHRLGATGGVMMSTNEHVIYLFPHYGFRI